MKTVGIPLVLTFQLDPVSQATLNQWREQYFPKERNHLKAHLTIYHQLPGQELSAIKSVLEEFAREKSPFAIRFDHLLHRQGFVGVALKSEDLLLVRTELSERFLPLLRAQDKQGYRPHVTITNLGSPREAQNCFLEIEKIFSPWSGSVRGVELFHYRGGPWELEEVFPFSKEI